MATHVQTAAGLVKYTRVIATEHWKVNVNSLFNPRSSLSVQKYPLNNLQHVLDYVRLQSQALSFVPVQQNKNLKRMDFKKTNCYHYLSSW